MSTASAAAPQSIPVGPSVLGDLIAPSRIESVSDFLLNALLVLGGVGFVALLAQVTIPTTPVPVTGQTLGVILVGSALGSVRGVVSMLLYLGLGLFLPILAGGESGVLNDIGTATGATAGYLIGFVVAAGIVGWLSEKGRDRRFTSALGAFVVGELIIFAFGLIGLKMAAPELVEAGFMESSSWGTVLEDGFVFFFGWEILKAAIAALLMPAAWKVADLRRSRDGRPNAES